MKPKKLGTVKYYGESTPLVFINGKIYDCYETNSAEYGSLRVMDEEMDDDPDDPDYMPGYLYNPKKPTPNGRFEVVDDPTGILTKLING